MCQTCGQTLCSCDKTYQFNWYNINDQPCTSCGDATVCKKKIPAKCTIYNGTLLSSINLEAGANVEQILAAIDAILSNISTSGMVQTTKNNSILDALNSINARLNALEGGTAHADYTI